MRSGYDIYIYDSARVCHACAIVLVSLNGVSFGPLCPKITEVTFSYPFKPLKIYRKPRIIAAAISAMCKVKVQYLSVPKVKVHRLRMRISCRVASPDAIYLPVN